MTLQDWGAAIGAGFGTAGLVIAGGKQWLSKRAEKKIDAVSVELGVGIGPSIASLVMSTAETVQRLDKHMGGSGERIEELIRVQGVHADQLSDHADRLGDHDIRIVNIESRHETCAFDKEQVAALLATKTEQVADELATKTEHVAEALAAKTVKTARALRGRRAKP